MKKKYFKIKTKSVPLYKGELVLVVTNHKKKVRKMFPKSFDKGDEPYAHAIEGNYKGHMGYHVVLNFDHSFADMTYGTVSHEAYHITSFIADKVGILHDPDNDEAMAYLNGWIADQLYCWIDELGFKIELNG